MKRISKFHLILLLTVILVPLANAQQQFCASVYKNSIAMPGGGFGAPLHPGIEIGWIKTLKDNDHFYNSLSVKLGYNYQRLIHAAIPLYVDYSARVKFFKNWNAGISFGLGYCHTFKLHDVFIADDEGNYSKKQDWGNAHAVIDLGAVVNYRNKKLPFSPYVEYKFNILTPYIGSSVPVLPTVSIHLGASFPINF